MTILSHLLILLILFVGIHCEAAASANHDVPLQKYKLYVPRISTSSKEFLRGNFFYNYQYCQAIGLQATTPNTPDKLAYLGDFMKENELTIIWTSGNCLAESGKFVWMVNSRPLDFVDWHDGEPNGGQCVDIWLNGGKYKMSDQWCNQNRTIICETLPEY